MTRFYEPEVIDVLKARVAVEPCTCVYVVSDPYEISHVEVCVRCLILGLQPTVEAFEPTL